MNNKNKTRIRYSKEFKRKALLEIAKGKTPLEVLKSSGFNLDEVLKNDKKYPCKIIHKWKKEFYEHNEIIQTLNGKITDKKLLYEIENMYDDTDVDLFGQEIDEENLNQFDDIDKDF